jgi:hypothetical protein
MSDQTIDSYGARLRVRALERRADEVARAIRATDREIARQEKAQHGLEDFYFFCKHILGFKQLYRPLHGELCATVSNEELKRKLILYPRGHFKTTIISICYPLWILCRNQDARIALISVSADKAKENLAEIRDRAQRKEFQELYGERIGHPDTWPKADQDTVRIRRSGSTTGPSISAYGVDSKEVGRHFDFMLMDDIVDQEKVNSPETRDSVWAWFGRQLSVLDPGCCMVVLGTNWHDDDVYSRIQRNMTPWTEGNPLGWYIAKRKAIENGQCIFPQRFTKEILAEIKKIQGDYVYSCFYENEPVGEGVNPFDVKQFQWIEYDHDAYVEEYGHENAPIPHLFVDPASSDATWACYSGIVLCDARSDKTTVIREAWLQKLHPDQLIDWIFSLVIQHDVRRVGIEDEAYQRSLIYWVRREMQSRNINFTVMPVKIPRNVQANTRLGAVQPFIHRGDIKFRANMEGRGHILEEFSRFPKGSHRDLIAAISMIPHCVLYPATHRKREKKPETAMCVEFMESMCSRPRRRQSRWERVKVRCV